ncbi:MAG: 50S ribosomal protein L7/L12 [Candidatus Spechtbacteria bacterium SB0662_bin_43]|uniref:Large ribosomal subunit protein bL12 n=1 Tax=Candidatus Spechtbacteria bacterium SB0662_bin_43 TaxID=2604897 RepID=A0A845DAC4_9BACT|nr:50S ribosomal protein L7/L12 [Candidatus Spechtbacteria bacterium SB0662_bin_43]
MTAKKAEKDTAPEKKEETTGTEEVAVPKKFEALVKQIEELSLLDASELVSILEKKLGVSAAAPMMMAGAATPAAGEAEDSVPSTVTVELTDVGSNKIGVIKALRAITELGLKEAKDLADGAPAVVKENVAREEAEEMKKQLEEAGGTVTLK